ncbi:uncharacterized protein PV09_08850 [Verruconis gallopava]|uniref:Chromatin modification-related protein EAF6 n=1 Tax=Verruconis gallopava TaxID=253628 RepID=A0A0D1XBI5_9PEZI|nr:uncharacterized protein PV09_08850 [Verruconis gallopava]KIV99550.1 hypothetical protein PV09_08850 [Verruconis gallopava]
MAENAPPPTSTSSGDSSRGMPYYEKLRRDLRETLQKKRALDASIMNLEDNIYRLETQYLEETTAGNIIKGFDNYIKGTTSSTTAGGAGTASRRKGGITDADRIFSRSSASFQRDSPDRSSNSTPSHAATPASSFHHSNHPTPSATSNKGSVAGNKKKKAPDDDDTDSKSTKRGKITYARE